MLLWHSKECPLTSGKKGESQEWYEYTKFALTCVLDFVTSQSDPQMIKEIVEAVTIPVMAKVRIGHFVEAQVGSPYLGISKNVELL